MRADPLVRARDGRAAGRARATARGAAPTAGGSHGWCGSGKLIHTNQSSSASSESRNSMVRSATQSVWYHSRGIGLFLVSGAPVSPPPLRVEQRREALQVLGMVLLQPAAVVPDRAARRRRCGWRGWRARSRATGRCRRAAGGAFSSNLQLRGRSWARSAPCRAAPCDSRRARARYAATLGASAGRATPLAYDAVRAHVLAGEHGRARRHADRVLVVGAPVGEAGARPSRRPPACARSCRRCSRARRSAAGRW